MSDFQILEQTRTNQLAASDPKASAFVAANAGSGKTFVLARRVTRLLLAGNEPSRILCLTFTKAAAAEMKGRVFDQLRAWSSMSDEDLDKELTEVEGKPATGKDGNAQRRQRARRLFAQALETPGGLRIQTIHAFCESLLHQFPLEAGIAGHFEVMDDELQTLLVQQARDATVASAQRAPESVTGKALLRLLEATSEFGFLEGLDALIQKRQAFREWIAEASQISSAMAELAQKLGVEAGMSRGEVVVRHFPSSILTDSLLAEQAALDLSATSRFSKQAELAMAYVKSADPMERFELACSLVLSGKGECKSASWIASKTTHQTMPQLEEAYQQIAPLLIELQGQLATLAALEATADLLIIGDRVINHFEQAKARRGLLDFSDLIARTQRLLVRGSARFWVQYKLDRGLDHVLVDEAQDTSPEQWSIIRQFVDEYFAGEGLRPGQARTVFAVGDEKQSIYSFQGAKPAIFEEQQRALGRLAEDADAPFSKLTLDQSFRSTIDVLSAVDAVFSHEQNYVGISSEHQPTSHTTARQNAPGEVEIWPLALKVDSSEPDDWTTPQAVSADESPEARLASRIAETVDGWLRQSDVLRGRGRAVLPDDIIILVRKRGAFMERLTGALKRLNLPVAGMDRFALTSHIAVQDMMALGRAVLMPEDDLSLAAVMKSPLLGLDEDDLFEIAMHDAFDGEGKRKNRSLISAFRGHLKQGGSPCQHEAMALFERWLSLADRYGVFGFYSAVLHTDNGRAKLLARLGGEAEDPIDSFLDLALSREGEGVPGLDGFLNWLEQTQPVIKRELEEAGGQIRIMTAHGAKGLEAPVVFLVDPGSPPSTASQAPRILQVDFNVPGKADALLWQPPRFAKTPFAEQAKLQREKLEAEEYRRLLYVGMTRAADRLIICGYQRKNTSETTWQEMAHDALVAHDESGDVSEVLADNGSDEIVAWRWCRDVSQPVAKPEKRKADLSHRTNQALPASLRQPAPAQKKVPELLRPSSAASELQPQNEWPLDLTENTVGAADDREAQLSPIVSEQSQNRALEKGNAVHRLLESLPEVAPANRSAAMSNYLTASLPNWSETERQKIATSVTEILSSAELAFLFGEGSRAEVPIVSSFKTASGVRHVSGLIDRLHIGDGKVTIADYKTNRIVPDSVDQCPEAYIVQMAIYAQIMADIYPGRECEALLIWTNNLDIMRLPTELLQRKLTEVKAL
jgi:ATP-dependent helicase/nuclease subunit A